MARSLSAIGPDTGAARRGLASACWHVVVLVDRHPAFAFPVHSDPFSQASLAIDAVTASGLPTSSVAERLVSVSVRDWIVIGMIELLSIFPAAISMRAGALYAAGRDGEGFGDTAKLTLSRWKTLLQVSLLPWVCVIGLSLPLLLVAAVSRIPTVGRGIAEVLGLLASPMLLGIGLLAAGALFAIPLALASIAVEKRDDGFDALSRGYEYILRRPVQTMAYSISMLLLMILVGAIFTLVSLAALSVAGTVLSLVNDRLAMLSVWGMLFTTLPLAAIATTKTALIAPCTCCCVTMPIHKTLSISKRPSPIASSPLYQRCNE